MSFAALHTHLVPFQVAFITSSQTNDDLKDLRQFFHELCSEEKLRVSHEVQDFDSADKLGIPFLVILKEDTLNNGIALIRDRETCWFEEIHVANIVRRLVHIYHERETKNTWAKLQDQISRDCL